MKECAEHFNTAVERCAHFDGLAVCESPFPFTEKVGIWLVHENSKGAAIAFEGPVLRGQEADIAFGKLIEKMMAG